MNSEVKLGAILLVQVGSRFIGIKCKKGRGIILPGGKWEKGETFSQTAVREFKEETGMDAEVLCLAFQGMSEEGYYTYAFIGHLNCDFLPCGDEEVVLTSWDQLLQSSFKGYYEVMKMTVKPLLDMGNI